jgi:hypothetical protein
MNRFTIHYFSGFLNHTCPVDLLFRTYIHEIENKERRLTMSEVRLSKDLCVLLAARTNPFFTDNNIWHKKSIEGDYIPEPITDRWVALSMLVRPFGEDSQRRIRLNGAYGNKHPFAVLSIKCSVWRKETHDYPIDEAVITELCCEGYVQTGTLAGRPYDLIHYISERGIEAVYERLGELASSSQ